MLQGFGLITLVLLIAPWGVTSQYWNFGCNKNVDALCTITASNDGGYKWVEWAHRTHPKKRDYWCGDWKIPYCCPQGTVDIDENNTPSYVPYGSQSLAFGQS
ncbi:hypothetical protein Pst134EA_004779 [Puccinia striiformis f. sp. tritici]|uniref:hypothetical protein n=1 Tax=Puccinia striiformis f. sp. tritici TaxID=168172 RepID=UPI0020087928|nr:hypothetical protein Pst134EA_004779 [Puccinia striiformis f. sp. tritici]KAH9470861.1 hypothetical protein Pst134EA_004779 [Puccinia striiformis f. sp. tritici]KAI9623140.1 hypothetical protein KEM48_009570 [Puccinia striiformis f. sp. tritici PST-130]